MAVLEIGINIGMKNLVEVKYYSSSDNILDPWNGTPEHPYQTIKDGLIVAKKGETVVIQEGTYHITESLIVPDSVMLFMNPKVTS